MTLKQLEAFYWAAKLGSFAIAADRLFISQSSLSKRIAELEASLGKPLFDRSARRATLTPAGELALDHVKRMLDTEADLRHKLETAGKIRGALSIGIGELSTGTWFPGFMARAASELPDLVVEPMVSLARTMERLVERGTLDCAVIAGRTALGALASQHLCNVEFAWVASPALHLPRWEVTPSLLQSVPVIGPTASSGYAQAFGDWLAANGGRIERTVTCNSSHAMVELAVAGVGITVLPRRYLQPILQRKLLVLLESTPEVPPLDYTFIWRHDDTRQLIPQVRKIVQEEARFDRSTPLWTLQGKR